MAKAQKIIYTCSKCDAQYPKWLGRCAECGAWSTLVKAQALPKTRVNANNRSSGQVETLSEVRTESEARLPSGINEFDRVLGGGIVPSSLMLLGGDPGIGKSTLILQVGGQIAGQGKEVLYISGEESAAQVKIRFSRLGLNTANLKFLGETDLDTIISTIDKYRPELVIIDSIQTMADASVDSAAGSMGQVRSATVKLQDVVKRGGMPIIIIGHVTKQGNLAGPRTMEHLVDVVLYLEGDKYHAFRVLRGVKNRFGSTSEVGVFDMQAGGLREVANPSEIFLAERKAQNPGTVITAVVEGSRAFLVEIQALVSRSNFGYPQRRVAGYDYNRLQLLIAVLTKKSGVFLGNQDVHVNVAGGFKVTEPAVDLAVCLAIISAFRNKPVPKELAVFGEVGLGGELRAVNQVEKRLQEVQKMGFKEILMPFTKLVQEPQGIQVFYRDSVNSAIKEIFLA